MENRQRESMVFYDSFFEAVRDLPAEEYKKCVNAILMYGLRGETPETYGIEKTIFVLVKPQIDKNNQRWLNAKRSHNVKEKSKNDEDAVKEKTCGAAENSEDDVVAKSCENRKEVPEITACFDDTDDEETAFDESEMIVSSCDCYGSFDDTANVSDVREAYGEFNNVYLSQGEKKRLIDELGVREFFDRIEFFSGYLKRKPNHKSACHYIDLRDWVGKAVAERKPKEEPKKTALFDFDFEDIYERP